MFDANFHFTLFILHLLQSLFPGINYLQFSHPELSLAIKTVLESENCTLLPEQVSASDLSVANLSDSKTKKERTINGVYVCCCWCCCRRCVGEKISCTLGYIWWWEAAQHTTQQIKDDLNINSIHSYRYNFLYKFRVVVGFFLIFLYISFANFLLVFFRWNFLRHSPKSHLIHHRHCYKIISKTKLFSCIKCFLSIIVLWLLVQQVEAKVLS